MTGKVYALEVSVDYEGDTLVSLHATREGAEARAKADRYRDEDRDVEFWEHAPGIWKATRSSLSEFHITEREVEA